MLKKIVIIGVIALLLILVVIGLRKCKADEGILGLDVKVEGSFNRDVEDDFGFEGELDSAIVSVGLPITIKDLLSIRPL